MVGEAVRDLVIAEMTADDLPAVMEIERSSFSTTWSETSFFNEIKNPKSIATVARMEGRIVGYICASRIIDEGHILTYAVQPDSRRRGVGAALAGDMIGRLKEEACRFIFLEVRDSNKEAKKMYEKFGFAFLGVRKNYYNSPVEDAVVMVLRLAD